MTVFGVARVFLLKTSNIDGVGVKPVHDSPIGPDVTNAELRIIDESGEDYLYPAEWFVPVELPRRIRGSLLRTR